MSLRVVVTRPAREATEWVQKLQTQGLQAWALPLIDIRPASDQQAVAAARARWGQWDGALFVSANAVEHFFGVNQPLAPVNTASAASKTIAFAPGPGTARALLGLGLPPTQVVSPDPDSAQFDSEALWHKVQHRVGAGFGLLVVRGTTDGAASQDGQGRDWFAAQVLARGGKVEHVVVYTRGAPNFSDDDRARVECAASDGSVWLFSSSEAIANLCAQMPLTTWSQARAVCTHPRIAQAARKAGFGVVCESRPALDSVRASIESLR